MSVYRENAAPAAETVREFPISTRRGHGLVVALGVVAILLVVAAGVSIFAGAPPPLEPWTWPMAAGGIVALVAAVVVHRGRRRTMAIVRTGDLHHLVVEAENVRIEFPLAVTGDQMTTSIRGIPMYHVWLKLVDASGQAGVFLEEVRGAIHGPQRDWLTGIDRTVACDRFESGRVGMLAELRAAVEAINTRQRGPV